MRGYRVYEHKADGGEAQEGERVVAEVFPILGEAAAAVEPGDCALDDPALAQLRQWATEGVAFAVIDAATGADMTGVLLA